MNLEQNVFTSAFHQTTNIYPDKNTLVQRLELGRYTYDPPTHAPVSDHARARSNSGGKGEPVGGQGGGGMENEWRGAARDNGGDVLKTLMKVFPNAYEVSVVSYKCILF